MLLEIVRIVVYDGMEDEDVVVVLGLRLPLSITNHWLVGHKSTAREK